MKEFETVIHAAYPASLPGDDLLRKLQGAARSTDRRIAVRKLWRRRVRLSLATCAVGGFVVGAVVLRPRIAFAYTILRAESAMNSQTVAAYQTWILEDDGTRTPGMSVATRGDEARITRGQETILYTGDKTWVYEAGSRFATYEPEDRAQVARLHVTTGTALLKELMSYGVSGAMQVDDEDGFVVASIVGKSERTRLRLFIDKASDLPVKMEIQNPYHGGWKVAEDGEFRFGSQVDANLFAPVFPKGVQTVDKRDTQRRLQAKWSKPLLSIRERGDGEDLRDVQVNEAGDVFILYTARRDGGKVRVSDNLGTTYLEAQDFGPTVSWTSGRVDGFKFPEGKLLGALFVPLTPPKETERTLDVVGMPMMSQPLTPASLGKRELVNGQEVVAWDLSVIKAHWEEEDKKAPDVEARTYHLKLSEPSCSTLPDYMTFLPQPIWGESDLRARETQARGDYEIDHRLWTEAERDIREAIAKTDQYYRETGNIGVQPDNYFKMYTILAAEGKHQEAVSWLRQLPDQMVYRNDDLQRRYKDAAAKEGL
jgi:hypothetical protein